MAQSASLMGTEKRPAHCPATVSPASPGEADRSGALQSRQSARPSLLQVWLSAVGVCLLAIAVSSADERDFSGTVRKVFDGDSFLVRPLKGRAVDVRLQDIDAPEKDQPYGNTARSALTGLIGGREVFVDVIETDRYGRKVVRVYREPDRLDVVKAMVRDGHVWVYRRTLRDRSLIELEEAARAARRGLWALPAQDRVPPWQYRYQKRRKRTRSSVAARVAFALESAQASRFHQPITPVAPDIVIAPGAEWRGEAGAGWTLVVPQAVEVADQLHAQR